MSAPSVPEGIIERLEALQAAARMQQEMTAERFEMLRELDADGVFTDESLREKLKAAIY